jgi:DNA-binding LytR/AlgR family response regulator
VDGEKHTDEIIRQEVQSGDSFIYVKENKRVVKIDISKIVFIEGLSEYVQIFTDQKKIVTKTSLTNLVEKLPAQNFIRIHKSYIVPLSRVEAFTANSIGVPGKQLPIGRNYKNSVLNALQVHEHS